MRAGPDLLGALGCPNGKLDPTPVDLRHLSLPGNQASNRRRREMAHVDGRADRALAGIEWREASPKASGGLYPKRSQPIEDRRAFMLDRMLRIETEAEEALEQQGNGDLRLSAGERRPQTEMRTAAKGNVPASRSRTECCSSEPPRELSHVDNDPGMRAGPDLLAALGCSDGELDLAPVDLRHRGLPVAR